MAAMLSSTKKDSPERVSINPAPCTYKHLHPFSLCTYCNSGARHWSPGVPSRLWPLKEDSLPSRSTQIRPGCPAPHHHLPSAPRGSLCSPFPHLLAKAKLLTFTFQGLFTSKSPSSPAHPPPLDISICSAQPSPISIHPLPPAPLCSPHMPPCKLFSCCLYAWISLLKLHLACIRSLFLPPYTPSQN